MFPKKMHNLHNCSLTAKNRGDKSPSVVDIRTVPGPFIFSMCKGIANTAMNAKIQEQIIRLKEENNAVILAHNYQLPEVQDIADFTGDSLELAREGARVPQQLVVFCGVHFMAETCAIFSPDKTVLLPDETSGCPMADMATGESLAALKAQHPGAVVVCYVNSTAEVKAQSDVCCTSAHAVDIIRRIEPGRPIIFVPDKYLGGYVSQLTGREMIYWEGACPIHATLRPAHVEAARAAHPGAPIFVHPESPLTVSALADEVLSTGQMCTRARQSDASTIVIGTELGLLHRLRKENPDKTFVPLSDDLVCPNMKRNTLPKVLHALTTLTPVIRVEETLARQAAHAIQTMFADGVIRPRNADAQPAQ